MDCTIITKLLQYSLHLPLPCALTETQNLMHSNKQTLNFPTYHVIHAKNRNDMTSCTTYIIFRRDIT